MPPSSSSSLPSPCVLRHTPTSLLSEDLLCVVSLPTSLLPPPSSSLLSSFVFFSILWKILTHVRHAQHCSDRSHQVCGVQGDHPKRSSQRRTYQQGRRRSRRRQEVIKESQEEIKRRQEVLLPAREMVLETRSFRSSALSAHLSCNM